jgi:hypothetical protein
MMPNARIDTDAGEVNRLNRYQSSVEILSTLLEENLRTEAYKVLWVLTVLNARVEGLDSTDIEGMRKSLTGLTQYAKSGNLARFIEVNGEAILSYGGSKMELSPFVVEHRYLRKGKEKGIIIGWIIRDLKTVENPITRLLRLEKSKVIWIDRHNSTEMAETEVLVTEPITDENGEKERLKSIEDD